LTVKSFNFFLGEW